MVPEADYYFYSLLSNEIGHVICLLKLIVNFGMYKIQKNSKKTTPKTPNWSVLPEGTVSTCPRSFT